MDKERIARFADTVYRDMAGAMAIGMGYIGQKTGLFRALADGAEVTAGDLAEATWLVPRYVEEWLKGMTAAGWLEHRDGRYRLPEEHAYLLASEGSDHFMGGLFLAGPALLEQAPRVAEAFREGGGVPFGAFGADWIEAMDLMNGGAYDRRLVSYWLGFLPDVVKRLNAGGRALDVGCGVGKAAAVLAGAFPKAEIVGADPDPKSIAAARASTDAGNLSFVAGTVEDLPEAPRFDLITLFDCLHDLTDPRATLAAIRARLEEDGALMVMEPRAADRLEDNINPLGATYYGFSLFHCMTQSLAAGGPGLGTCLGPAHTMQVLRQGGFSRVEPLEIKSQTSLFYAARL